MVEPPLLSVMRAEIYSLRVFLLLYHKVLVLSIGVVLFLMFFWMKIYEFLTMGEGVAKLSTTSSFDARTAPRRAVPVLMLLLGVSQEVAKKETQAFPLGPPCLPPFYNKRRGFCCGKIPPSWAHKRTPKMGVSCWQKFLLSRFV
jgi:hypothetical protein